MAQVNIKPNRIKFIKALEESIKRIESEAKEYEAAHKQYQKDLEVWRKTADLSPENIKDISISMDYRSNEPTKEVKVILKKVPTNAPKKPVEPLLTGYRRTEALEDLRSVIVMLKLTDEETVNASVANKVAKYL